MRWNRLWEAGWNVAIRPRTDRGLPEDRRSPFTLLPNTWYSWEADPFVFEHSGSSFVFAEQYDYRCRRGGIACCELTDGMSKGWKTVLREPFHLSYPLVFSRGGEIYMLPESSEAGQLRRYRAVNFPYEWTLDCVLREQVKWVDTTPFEQDETRYALTTDIAEPAQRTLLLTLDESGRIDEIHPIAEREPLRARAGGAVLQRDGQLLRVTQDCTQVYGGALEFSALDVHTLCQQGMPAQTVRVEPNEIRTDRPMEAFGVHTYNCSEHYEVIDLERNRFTAIGLVTRLCGKLSRGGRQR